MPDRDQTYDKDSVNLWVDPERKRRWQEYVEEESEFQYLSQVIRQAVEQKIQQDQPTGDTAELSETVLENFDDLRRAIQQLEQVMQEVEKRLSGLERQVRDDPKVRQLANQIYDRLPTQAEIKEYERKVSDGATLREIGAARTDSGRIEALADALDVQEAEVQTALDRLQEDTHQVHAMEWDDEMRYYKEG